MATSVEFLSHDPEHPSPPGSALDKSIELSWLALGLLEGLFAIRFALKLIAANAGNPFADLVYSFTDLFLKPFEGLTATPTANGMVLEVSTVFAMVVYALALWVLIRVVGVLFDKPPADSVAIEVRERSRS